MPEIMSAEELVDSTMEDIFYPNGLWMTAKPNRPKLIEGIKKRNSAIIEKCKEAIRAYADSEHKLNVWDLDYFTALANAEVVLDSVLSDINGNTK